MIAEVSSKLIDQFVDSLEKQVMATPEQASVASTPADTTVSAVSAGAADIPASKPAFRPTQEPEAVNLTQLAGGAVAKRLLPVVGLLVVAGIIIYVIVR
jgi:hypothetical protein